MKYIFLFVITSFCFSQEVRIRSISSNGNSDTIRIANYIFVSIPKELGGRKILDVCRDGSFYRWVRRVENSGYVWTGTFGSAMDGYRWFIPFKKKR